MKIRGVSIVDHDARVGIAVLEHLDLLVHDVAEALVATDFGNATGAGIGGLIRVACHCHGHNGGQCEQS